MIALARIAPGLLGIGLVLGIASAQEPKVADTTLDAPPPKGAVVLFDGKDLSHWVKAGGKDKAPAEWKVEEGAMVVAPGKGNIVSKESFGDFRLHIEFNVPLMPEARGQARGNSGVYLGGIYELQVLDSFGLEKPQTNDCGAIYQQVAPRVNACRPPLQWQTYDVVFRKARVEDGKVVEKARVTVVQNGITIIDDKEIAPTPGGVGNKAGEDGPFLLQDHGNKVKFKNIWVVKGE